jgi:hypothetical protein
MYKIKDYLKKSYWKILIFYFFIVLLLSLNLHFNGTGYMPGVTHEGSGPLSWNEIYNSYKYKVLKQSMIPTIIVLYFGYWDYQRKKKKISNDNYSI